MPQNPTNPLIEPSEPDVLRETQNDRYEKARASFSTSAWNQGEAYLASGAVTPGAMQHTARGFVIAAEVRRSARRSYQVTIVCDDAGAYRWHCTCPFEVGGGCAHCAAVVMLWCRRPDLFGAEGTTTNTIPPAPDPATPNVAPPAELAAASPLNRGVLWVAPDGAIQVDLAATGARADLLRATLGEHLSSSAGDSRGSLTALGFANALQQGIEPTQVLTALADVAAGRVPPKVMQQIQSWTAAADNLHLYDSLCVIEFADDFILQELLRVSGLRHYLVHIFSPRIIAVQPKQVAALAADLEARGYMPKMEPV